MIFLGKITRALLRERKRSISFQLDLISAWGGLANQNHLNFNKFLHLKFWNSKFLQLMFQISLPSYVSL